MTKKILFWLNADFTYYSVAYYLQNKSDYEFYAIIDGEKVIGGAMITNKLNIIATDLVYNLVFDQFSHDELNLIIPIEKLYDAKFYVDANGSTRELRLDEVYRGL